MSIRNGPTYDVQLAGWGRIYPRNRADVVQPSILRFVALQLSWYNAAACHPCTALFRSLPSANRQGDPVYTMVKTVQPTPTMRIVKTFISYHCD